MAQKHNEEFDTFAAVLRERAVVIRIGPEKVKYYVHAALLIQHSEYFKKALSGPWKEAEEGVISLEDVDCETFNIFVGWLYTKRLPRWNSSKNVQHNQVENDPENDQPHGPEGLLIKAYVFGDRFLALDFRRAAQNNLVNEAFKAVFYYRSIRYAFENLPAEDIILSFIIDMHCLNYCVEDDTEENGEVKCRAQLPVSFLTRAMMRYSEMIHGLIIKPTPCDYHEHASEEEKEICKVEHAEAGHNSAQGSD